VAAIADEIQLYWSGPVFVTTRFARWWVTVWRELGWIVWWIAMIVMIEGVYRQAWNQWSEGDRVGALEFAGLCTLALVVLGVDKYREQRLKMHRPES
jgi:hypothetical protein